MDDEPNPTQPNPTKEHPLSVREGEVLDLIARGHKDLEIARVLEIEECTVRFHVRNLFEKLGVKNRAAAVYHAVKNGWID